MTDNDVIDCYPEQIQYFFTHIVKLPGETSERVHNLAFIQWYNKHESSYYNFSIDNNKTCNVELWSTEFFLESQDCIISIYHIFGQFVLVTSNFRAVKCKKIFSSESIQLIENTIFVKM